jgi:hypothetical protein
VIIVSSDPGLFDSVRTVLGADHRFIDAGDTVHCDGSVSPHTNIFPIETDPEDWDDWDATASEMPDPRTSSLLMVETRSPEWLAEVGRLLAQGLTTPVWIVDSADTPWPADQIDSAKVVLA